jgi:hypothetical protein
MERGRKAEIAKAAGITAPLLTQLLSGKIYKGMRKPREASWKTYEALGQATNTPPELWARSIANGEPEIIVAAIAEADRRRKAAASPETNH